ncbi:hypothetical protein LIER_14023 [Lithospermum erythrorhizon]|uniref:Pentatricopeptide repeat-containing protein n=1 Tax=Lithospermum erythrorhizon TaxID=34254 RepID=A0AAV3Q0R3_LITER
MSKITHLLRRFSSSSSNSYLNQQITIFLSTNNNLINQNTLIKSHAYIITSGHFNNLFIATKLISLYASLNQLKTSTKIFNFTTFRDPFLWNSIIKAHFDNLDYYSALKYFELMRFSGFFPSEFTIPMVVSACGEFGVGLIGKIIHGLVLKLGLFELNTAVGSGFIYMYSKCGCMEGACKVLDEMPKRDVVAWTALVIGYVQNGEMWKGLKRLQEMHEVGGDSERPNGRTLEGGFQACGELGALMEGRCLHGLSVKYGSFCSEGVRSSILSMYSKCGAFEEACRSFEEVANKDLMSWTSIIGVYVRMGRVEGCLSMLSEMQAGGVHPDGVVISCVLSGFGNSMKVSEGRVCHGFILRRDYGLDKVVLNGLILMYCRFGRLNLAEKLFGGGHGHSKETWNIMTVGYGRAGSYTKCIGLFREMQYLEIESDSNSLVALITSCSRLKEKKLGRSLHCTIIKNCIVGDISVTNSLIDMYGRGGNLTVVQRMFRIVQKDAVTWSALVASYVRKGLHMEALDLFEKMLSEGVTPNTSTLVTLLSASSHIASLDKGNSVHKYIIENRVEISVSLATALCDMYAKCGQLIKAREIFDSMEEKDDVSWNVMVSGYGMHGNVESAIGVFRQMEEAKVQPNELTFLALLSTCAHAGLVEEGKSLFQKMKDYSLSPTQKHYSCMVDLLGRSGHLHDAEALILSMPIAPDGEVWGALVTACKIHDELRMGIRVANNALKSDPENDGYYVTISDLYSSLGMWDEVERIREIMKQKEVKKRVGWSTV